MRSLFKFIIAALILTACSQTPILPIATPLPSMTSTSIPIVTPTFSPTLTFTPPTPDLTPAPPIKEAVEYDVIKDPYEFRSCKLPIEQIPDYVRSLKKFHSNDRVYDPSKLLFNELKNYGGLIFYDIKAPNYTDPQSRPFERGAYCLTEFTTPSGEKIEYFVSFVQYYQEGLTPEEYPWVAFVAPTKPGVDKALVDAYMKSMNFPVIVTSGESQNGLIVGDDPLTSITFEKFSDMAERFERFLQGDFTALDGESGIVLGNRIRQTNSDQYK